MRFDTKVTLQLGQAPPGWAISPNGSHCGGLAGIDDRRRQHMVSGGRPLRITRSILQMGFGTCSAAYVGTSQRAAAARLTIRRAASRRRALHGRTPRRALSARCTVARVYRALSKRKTHRTSPASVPWGGRKSLPRTLGPRGCTHPLRPQPDAGRHRGCLKRSDCSSRSRVATNM